MGCGFIYWSKKRRINSAHLSDRSSDTKGRNTAIGDTDKHVFKIDGHEVSPSFSPLPEKQAATPGLFLADAAVTLT